ncbi:hypothetical protein N7492_004039 [Penicillium capsulatum]|uniref:Uncharacterized protein n=1 Tax=Penicillium capsulatum TaxID=69766 RepID=A0A9W9IMZ0_9EURO|nr:hypothetical protein N7492_004039 [Penicillium capsulatum]
MQALYQQRGQIVQDWLTYPTEPCPIPRSTLIFQDLSASPVYVAEGGHDGVLPPAYDVNYPRDVGAVDESHFRRYIVEQDNPHQEWFGITAPGVLIIEDIKRQKTKPPRTDLSMSEISMAVYTDRFDASTLRYVIYANVNNKETLFVGRCLYEMRRPSTDIQVWEYGSPEYQKFLGSRLGKLTAYMLLGTFERGTRRIARVVTWTNAAFGPPWVRFDIDVVSRHDVPHPSIEPADPVEFPRAILEAIRESSPVEEMLPPPVILRAYGSMTPGQTVQPEIPQCQVADCPRGSEMSQCEPQESVKKASGILLVLGLLNPGLVIRWDASTSSNPTLASKRRVCQTNMGV